MKARDLRRRVGVRGLWYAGDHGFFVRSPRGAALRLVRPAEIAAVTGVARELRRVLAGVPGVTVELKQASVAVHYRSADRLRLMAGKCVWEILPRVRVDKRVAVRAILDAERGHRPGRDLPVIFIGDDVTDEPVYTMRLTLSASVGRRRTRAVYRLRSPDDPGARRDRPLMSSILEAEHPLRPRADVADHVVPHVADVRVARRIGEHLEAVELRLRGIFGDFERAGLRPPFLPLLFRCLGVGTRPRGIYDIAGAAMLQKLAPVAAGSRLYGLSSPQVPEENLAMRLELMAEPGVSALIKRRVSR